jgi:hypothetical protein
MIAYLKNVKSTLSMVFTLATTMKAHDSAISRAQSLTLFLQVLKVMFQVGKKAAVVASKSGTWLNNHVD